MIGGASDGVQAKFNGLEKNEVINGFTAADLEAISRASSTRKIKLRVCIREPENINVVAGAASKHGYLDTHT